MHKGLILAVSLILAALPGLASAQDAPEALKPRRVMTWVPPYAIPAATEQLKARHGGAGPRTALTHLGLQFWLPTADGRLRRAQADAGEVNDAQIRDLAAFGRRNGIKVLLCVYNATESGWDWPLALSAFRDHRAAFVAALVAEVRRFDLDGVDVDLEGPEPQPHDLNEDKPAFLRFVKALAAELQARGKEISVDSFPYVWNAPNSTWWGDLLPLVDGLNSMGYGDTGRNAPGWQAYAAQKEMAGRHAGKLTIGLPSWLDAWQGDTAADQIAWFTRTRAVGVSIWDAQFQAASWRERRVWSLLERLRSGTR